MISINKMRLITAIYEASDHYGIDKENESIGSLVDRLLLDYAEEITGKKAEGAKQ
ncbi:hypothetical protein [Bacillus sp. 7894-2]|uniref:hypothetical protein n=1 Tax=Bacillus sp. 7894-2 TaxID=2021695 RepID=UPI0015C78131|nr:hypothetical protein [Bacillus sp. 7894-2]